MKKLILAIIAFMFIAVLLSPVFAGGGDEDEVYIPVISKGFQHDFWQAVKRGSEDAAEELGVTILFEGPEGEAAIQDQVIMVQNALAKNPSAIALAALDTTSVIDQLEEAIRRNIPVIGFDSGVPNAPVGAIYANASTNNLVAGGIAAEKMFEVIKDQIEAATERDPVTIIVFSQDATSESVTGRGKGFRNKIVDLIVDESSMGRDDIAVIGNPAYIADSSPTTGTKVIIDMVVAATPGTQDVVSAATAITNRIDSDGILGVFCSNEGTINGLLSATNDGADLNSLYSDLVVIGFDAGTGQKNAVRAQLVYGSITQDPYQIGYKAVELAAKAVAGEPVSDVDTGARFYNYANMDDPVIAPLLYD